MLRPVRRGIWPDAPDERINIRGVVPRPNYQTVGTSGASGRPATSHASLPPRYQWIWV